MAQKNFRQTPGRHPMFFVAIIILFILWGHSYVTNPDMNKGNLDHVGETRGLGFWEDLSQQLSEFFGS